MDIKDQEKENKDKTINNLNMEQNMKYDNIFKEKKELIHSFQRL